MWYDVGWYNVYAILFQADRLDVDLVVAHAVDEPVHQERLLFPVYITQCHITDDMHMVHGMVYRNVL